MHTVTEYGLYYRVTVHVIPNLLAAHFYRVEHHVVQNILLTSKQKLLISLCSLQFLRFLGRDQFDPRQPNYVSPTALVRNYE